MSGKLELFLTKAIEAYGKGNSAHLGDRSNYIGASDIAGCPRKAVLSRQTPQSHSVTTQLRFAWGHLSQELFSRLFQTGGLPFAEEVEIIHPLNPRIRCHIDFLFKGNNRWHVVEKKATGEIPSEPYASWVDQLHFQMGMLKRFHPEAAKGGIIGGSILAAKPLPKEDTRVLVSGVKEFNSYTPNDIVFEGLMKKGEHILAALDGKVEARCESSLICGVCPYETGCPARSISKCDIPADVTDVAKAYLDLMEEKKRLEADIEALKEDLLRYTGKSYRGATDEVAIKSFMVKDSLAVDSKKLQEIYPDVYKACTKPKSGGVRLEVSRVKVQADAPAQEKDLKMAA